MLKLPSLSELTPFIYNMDLTQLGSKASIYDIIDQWLKVSSQKLHGFVKCFKDKKKTVEWKLLFSIISLTKLFDLFFVGP